MKPMKVVLTPISSLGLDSNNARKHNPKNLRALKNSPSRFGQQKPIVVTSDNTVIAGNGTLMAARELGWSEIQVVTLPADWSAEEIKAYALADNRTAELAEWDEAVLAQQLVELDELDFDIAELGFELAATPPTDPYEEWEGMPDFEQGDKMSAFHCTIHFASESDAEEFFAKIDRPKKSSFWYPEHDGLVGSDVNQQYVIDAGE